MQIPADPPHIYQNSKFWGNSGAWILKLPTQLINLLTFENHNWKKCNCVISYIGWIQPYRHHSGDHVYKCGILVYSGFIYALIYLSNIFLVSRMCKTLLKDGNWMMKWDTISYLKMLNLDDRTQITIRFDEAQDTSWKQGSESQEEDIPAMTVDGTCQGGRRPDLCLKGHMQRSEIRSP